MIKKLFLAAACLDIFQMRTEGLACPTMYDPYGSSSKCLRIVTTLQTRDDSEVICEADDGQLAAIMTPEESIYIQENAPSYNDNWYWIGLTDMDKEGEFKWSDGTDVDYTYWYTDPNGILSPPQPNGDSDCVGASSRDSNQWYDRPCFAEYKALCQWPAYADIPGFSFPARFREIEPVEANLMNKKAILVVRQRSKLACATMCGTNQACTAISYSPTTEGDNCAMWAWSGVGNASSAVDEWGLFVKY